MSFPGTAASASDGKPIEHVLGAGSSAPPNYTEESLFVTPEPPESGPPSDTPDGSEPNMSDAEFLPDSPAYSSAVLEHADAEPGVGGGISSSREQQAGWEHDLDSTGLLGALGSVVVRSRVPRSGCEPNTHYRQKIVGEMARFAKGQSTFEHPSTYLRSAAAETKQLYEESGEEGGDKMSNEALRALCRKRVNTLVAARESVHTWANRPTYRPHQHHETILNLADDWYESVRDDKPLVEKDIVNRYRQTLSTNHESYSLERFREVADRVAFATDADDDRGGRRKKHVASLRSGTRSGAATEGAVRSSLRPPTITTSDVLGPTSVSGKSAQAERNWARFMVRRITEAVSSGTVGTSAGPPMCLYDRLFFYTHQEIDSKDRSSLPSEEVLLRDCELGQKALRAGVRAARRGMNQTAKLRPDSHHRPHRTLWGITSEKQYKARWVRSKKAAEETGTENPTVAADLDTEGADTAKKAQRRDALLYRTFPVGHAAQSRGRQPASVQELAELLGETYVPQEDLEDGE